MIVVNVVELGLYFTISLGIAASFICVRACLKPALYIFAAILVLRYLFGIHPIFSRTPPDFSRECGIT